MAPDVFIAHLQPCGGESLVCLPFYLTLKGFLCGFYSFSLRALGGDGHFPDVVDL